MRRIDHLRLSARWRVPATAVWLALVARPIGAQLVRGRIVTADSSSGIPSVIVTLRDSSGKEIARALSSTNGTFTLRSPASGRYWIRTLRIGYRAGDFGPFDLDNADQMSVLLPVRDIPVSLMGVRVSGKQECARSDEDRLATVTTWEEARKALLATAIADQNRGPVVTVVNYERVLTPETHHVIRQRVTSRSGPSGRPFVSPLAPDEYAARGYVETDSSGAIYRAPDAEVLLSESFARGHCFRLTRSAVDTALIGLSFTPTARPQAVIEVAGTLWLDRQTSELRRVEFKYVGLDPIAEGAGAGGQLEFVRLPSGLWMINRWSLRVPRLTVSNGFESRPSGGVDGASMSVRRSTRSSVAEVWEIGGVLTEVREADVAIWRGEGGTVSGSVVDDESNTPAVNVAINIRGTSYETRTDSAGRFELRNVLPGRYELDARSSALAALGGDFNLATDVEVGANAIARVKLRSPSLRHAIARVCERAGDHSPIRADAGLLVGMVHSKSGLPVAGASVDAQWLATVDLRGTTGAAGLSASDAHATVETQRDGTFRICGVALGRPITLSAHKDSLRSPAVVARLDERELVTQVDLRMSESSSAPAVDAAALTGTVLNDSGVPIPATSVDVIGVAAAMSDSTGRFRLSGLNPGVYLLRFRRIGFGQVIKTVQLAAGAGVTVDVRLTPSAQQLGAVTIQAEAERTYLMDPSGFEVRRQSGQGTFIAAADIDRRRASNTEELLRAIPGVRVDSAGVLWIDRGRQSFLDLEAGTSQFTTCLGVQVFIDGTLAPQPFRVSEIPVNAIRGIEFYNGPATTPSVLRGPKSTCGTVAIWTK